MDVPVPSSPRRRFTSKSRTSLVNEAQRVLQCVTRFRSGCPCKMLRSVPIGVVPSLRPNSPVSFAIAAEVAKRFLIALFGANVFSSERRRHKGVFQTHFLQSRRRLRMFKPAIAIAALMACSMPAIAATDYPSAKMHTALPERGIDRH